MHKFKCPIKLTECASDILVIVTENMIICFYLLSVIILVFILFCFSQVRYVVVCLTFVHPTQATENFCNVSTPFGMTAIC